MTPGGWWFLVALIVYVLINIMGVTVCLNMLTKQQFFLFFCFSMEMTLLKIVYLLCWTRCFFSIHFLDFVTFQMVLWQLMAPIVWQNKWYIWNAMNCVPIHTYDSWMVPFEGHSFQGKVTTIESLNLRPSDWSICCESGRN